MKPRPLPSLERTERAIEAYDAHHGDNYDPYQACEFARAVGVAFGLDTADRNNPAVCAELIRPSSRTPRPGETDVSFVRRMVRLWREQKVESEG